MNYSAIALLVLFVGCDSAPTAASPVIHYSDVISAPSEAFVTLYGESFGPIAGKVSFGDRAAEIYSWERNRIVVRRPDSIGPSVVVTNRNGENSNSINIALHDGRIYFVRPANSDGQSRFEEAGSDGGRNWTIDEFLRRAKPGDIAYLRQGTYHEIGNPVYGANVFIEPKHSGRDGQPIAIIGYPGEIAKVGTANTKHGIFVFNDVENFVLANLELNGKASALTLSPMGVRRNIRIVGNSATGVRSRNGVFQLNSTHGLFVLGNSVTDSGLKDNKFSHLIYYGGFGDGSDVHISYNTLSNEIGGRCIQVYGHRQEDRLESLFIKGNRISNCRLDAIAVGGSDARGNRAWIDEASISGNTVINSGGAGIRLNDLGMKAKVIRNRVAWSAVTLMLQNVGSVFVSDNYLLSDGRNGVANVGNVASMEVSENIYVRGNTWGEDRAPVIISRDRLSIDETNVQISILP